MHHPTAAELGEQLPGAWRVVATNTPLWLDGTRQFPRIAFELISAEPVRLSDDVTFLLADGQEGRLTGQSRWRGERFVRRRRGASALSRGHWLVDALDAEGELIVLRSWRVFDRSAGIDILQREGAVTSSVRPRVAAHTEELGLSPEEFASLTWIGLPTTG